MKQEDTRKKILTKALKLFSQRGYDAVSVGDIAAAVGVKAPSLYNHFSGKRAIFDAIVEAAAEQYEQDTAKAAPVDAASSLLPQHDGNEIQILPAAGLHGFAVAYGVLVLLPQPVVPDLLVALHFTDGQHLGAPAPAHQIPPVRCVVHIVQLLRRPGQQQLRRQVLMAVLFHAGDGDVDVPAAFYKGQQLLVLFAYQAVLPFSWDRMRPMRQPSDLS